MEQEKNTMNLWKARQTMLSRSLLCRSDLGCLLGKWSESTADDITISRSVDQARSHEMHLVLANDATRSVRNDASAVWSDCGDFYLYIISTITFV